MAVYGYDIYGKSKYGPFVKVDYGVEPFVASPLDYTRVYLSWSEPVGPWDEFRLLRSRSGYATAPDDGHVLVEFTKEAGSPPVDTQYLDPSLTGGWYYYTILLHSTLSDVWEVAGATSVLVPWDYESTETLWGYIPDFYRTIREGQTAGYSEVLFSINRAVYESSDNQVDNELLFKFMTIFGWGSDILKSQIETIRHGFDPANIHVSRLVLLADMFGASLPDTVPTQNNRNLVKNLALLYRKRGTLDGLRETLALTSGWDVDVYQGPNILLSRDQAAFVNLDIPTWDAGTRYITGDIVRYNNYYRQALQTAYGAAQAPATSATSNAYWSINPFTQPIPANWNPTTKSDSPADRVHGWQVQKDTGGKELVNVGLGIGIIGPIVNRPDGALTWVGPSGGADLLVRSVPVPNSAPLTAPDREDVVKHAIPVPRVTSRWVEGESYFRGDRVLYMGSVYQAVTETTDTPGSQSWAKVGYDERPRIGISFYAHGPFVGTTGTGGINVKPWVAFYDEQGTELVAKTVIAGQQFYDSFTRSGTVTNGRVPDVGSATWALTASWGQAADDEGGYTYPTSSTRTFQGYDVGANGNIGVTFRRIKTRTLGLFFRRVDNNNFWYASQTGLYKMTTGIPVQVGASYSCAEGDRLTVSFNGSAITVKKNGVQVVATTDSYNSSATSAGIFAEAV